MRLESKLNRFEDRMKTIRLIVENIVTLTPHSDADEMQSVNDAVKQLRSEVMAIQR